MAEKRKGLKYKSSQLAANLTAVAAMSKQQPGNNNHMQTVENQPSKLATNNNIILGSRKQGVI